MSTTRRGPGRPPGPPIRLPAALLARYRAGELSAAQLAALTGQNRNLVRAELRRRGLLRNLSQAMAAAHALRWGERRREILRLHAEGWSNARIGRRYGVTGERIRQIVAAGLTHAQTN